MLTFASVLVFRNELSTEGGKTILGGFVGSYLFIFLVTVSWDVLQLEQN